MASADDIADSTDWLNTPLAALAPVENALHCQICKEFFDTPMITSCCHTFCSKCIRTALSTDGCCPACRTQDQASKLRNNWLVQELVTTFSTARPVALKVAREQNDAASQRPGKRKRNDGTAEDVVQEAEGRTTRSKSRRTTNAHSPNETRFEAGDDNDYIDSEEEEHAAPPNDGLVECPLGCGKRMKIELVEPHLDRCEDERKAREKAEALRQARAKDSQSTQRLSELNYSMMKERDLARRLKDLGIPAWGNKQLMVRRHTAWVNIWNANCDSNTPRAKGDLIRELDAWERTHGGKMQVRENGVMKKEFDGQDWSKKHQDDFSRLIQQARESRAKATSKSEDAVKANGDTHTEVRSDEPLTGTSTIVALPDDRSITLSDDRANGLEHKLNSPRYRDPLPPHGIQPLSYWDDGQRAVQHQASGVGQEIADRSLAPLAPSTAEPSIESRQQWSGHEQPAADHRDSTSESLSLAVEPASTKVPMFAGPR